MKRTQYIAYFKVPYREKDNNNYLENDNFCCGDKKSSKGDGITDNEDPELNQFYYHSDHLGSSSYITNLKGSIVQHVEYVPFGEVFIEERNNKWNTPYLFNGKELDEETGLYYYGARYYSSRNSIFLSVDPLWEEKPSFSPYNYCSWNPVMRVDPDGRLDDWVERGGKVIWDESVTSEETKKAGDKYIGKEGYGINENTGGIIHYQIDGIKREYSQIISGVTVTPNYSYSTENPSISTHNQTGYTWDNRDLTVWNRLKNHDSPIGDVLRRQISTGNFDILSATNYWNTYGHTLGNLMLFQQYYDMMNAVSSYSGTKLNSYRRFNLKQTLSNSFSSTPNTSTLNNNWNSTKPTFNEFRSANKGTFKGYKGRGTSTKATWEAYKQLYRN